MQSSKEFLYKLKLKMNLKKYDECIQMLNTEIKNFYIKQIRKSEPNFKYSTMINLLEKGEQLLKNENLNNLKRFYIISKEELDIVYELECLMDIYNLVKEVV